MMRTIDADALLAIWGGFDDRYDDWLRPSDVVASINSAPTVRTAQQQTGHWIWDDAHTHCQCSDCKREVQTSSPFCPHCGAEMVNWGF